MPACFYIIIIYYLVLIHTHTNGRMRTSYTLMNNFTKVKIVQPEIMTPKSLFQHWFKNKSNLIIIHLGYKIN